MAEFVGVKSFMDVWKSGSFKRDALLFERIATPGLHLLREAHKILPAEQITDESQIYYAEMDWLEENGVIFEPDRLADYQLLNKSEEYKWYVEKESSLMDQVVKLTEENVSEEDAKVMGRILAAAHLNSRHTAIMLRDTQGMDAYPLFAGTPVPLIAPNTKESPVVRILLKNLPVPDDSVSWEQITDYRADPASKGKFIDLRNWMHEVARSELTPIEIEQKIEYLMSQYQRHMNIHKMKTTSGIIETSLVTTAEFAENLVKMKLGNAAKALFAFKQRRIELLEKELTAPGHELAYVLKTQRAFSK